MLKNNVALRQATLKDVEEIIEVAKLAWYATYEPILGYEQTHYMFLEIYNATNIESWISDGSQPFFLMTVGDELIGFAAFSQTETQVFKLNKIYLKPSVQGKGYGKLLLEWVEGEVKSRGGKTMVINVNRYNKALQFYQKLAYEIIEEVDIPFGPYFMNDYVLSRSLK